MDFRNTSSKDGRNGHADRKQRAGSSQNSQGSQARKSIRTPRNRTTNPQEGFTRYIALARAAAASGQTIDAENYYQHAEHYFRSMEGE